MPVWWTHADFVPVNGRLVFYWFQAARIHSARVIPKRSSQFLRSAFLKLDFEENALTLNCFNRVYTEIRARFFCTILQMCAGDVYV